MYEKHVIIVSVDYEYDSENAQPKIVGPITDPVQMAKELTNELSSHCLAVDELLKNRYFCENLERSGWMKLPPKVEVLRKDDFYLATPDKFHGYRVKGVALDELAKTEHHFDLEELASPESSLLQVIDKATLKNLSPKVYKKFLQAKAELTEKQKKSEAIAKKRTETARLKKIEKAKKIIAEAEK